MEKRLQWLRRGWVILLFLFVSIPHGCESAKRYTGTYVAVSEGGPSQMETILQLKEDDSGVWTADEKEVSFRWIVKGKEIRFHTKEGGVFIGKISDDTITVIVPGDKVMTFKKRHAY